MAALAVSFRKRLPLAGICDLGQTHKAICFTDHAIFTAGPFALWVVVGRWAGPPIEED
jgi:hypothetical protein